MLIFSFNMHYDAKTANFINFLKNFPFMMLKLNSFLAHEQNMVISGHKSPFKTIVYKWIDLWHGLF